MYLSCLVCDFYHPCEPRSPLAKRKVICPRKGGEWQFIDLEADGTETLNLAKSETNRVEELVRLFEAWQKHVGDKQ
ncbi:MAG TPA: hypothetical protein DD473_06470 [Planctomycetaceae bacterium]|nr:hypothetical protein [Planctomycetaceae bacterium]